MTSYAIPDKSAYYFTAGKRYPVIRWEGYENKLAVVRCDRGHERVVAEGRSPHLPPTGRQYYYFTPESLGSFSIVEDEDN